MADLVCAFWGPLTEHQLDHLSCDVILRDIDEILVYKGERQFTPPQIPFVCKCECSTCKRAWWKDGRPVIKEDGSIARRFGE